MDLGRHQFGKYLMARESSYGGVTGYSLWRQPKDPQWDSAEQIGSMEIEHKQPYSHTEYGQGTEYPTGQGTLFHHTSRDRPRDEVTSMVMSRQGRHMVPTMLGVAQNVARRTTGQDLAASTDLSRHSEALVGNLKGRGIVPESHTVTHRNTLNFAQVTRSHTPGGLEGLMTTHYDPEDLVTRSQVELGRHTVRRLLQAKQYTPVEERGPAKPGIGQGKLF